jgi:hypothetical protein
MNCFVSFVALALVGLVVARFAQADIIHESAILGPTGVSEHLTLSVSEVQFLGSRFSVNSTVEVQSVGGHLDASARKFLRAKRALETRVRPLSLTRVTGYQRLAKNSC